MAEEYFDILDEDGNPTGKAALRSEAHAEGLWHRTVHIYLFKKKEQEIEILVHLRAKTKDLHPNTWDTRFDGHVKAGETIHQALKNELQEEIGVDANTVEIMQGPVRRRGNFPNNEFTSTYFLNFMGDINTLRYNDGEVQEVKWMRGGEIIQAMKDHPEQWSGKAKGFEEIYAYLLR